MSETCVKLVLLKESTRVMSSTLSGKKWSNTDSVVH